jgi:SAM-dependent methyltransferase
MNQPSWLACHSREEWLAVRTSVFDSEQPPASAHEWKGSCSVCGHVGSFGMANSPVDFRETLHCGQCHCNARQRAVAHVLLGELGETAASARVYCTEQASNFFVALRRRVAGLVGSEFIGSWLQRLRLSVWLFRYAGFLSPIRIEDVTALRLRTATMHGIVSLDVLEHVPDYRAALREFTRVLRPGGLLVLTVPFYDDRVANEQIAFVGTDGLPEFIGEPEFHGDPMSDGVACFHHFGWDLLQSLREAGFSDAVALRVRSPSQGLPQGIWVLRARR